MNVKVCRWLNRCVPGWAFAKGIYFQEINSCIVGAAWLKKETIRVFPLSDTCRSLAISRPLMSETTQKDFCPVELSLFTRLSQVKFPCVYSTSSRHGLKLCFPIPPQSLGNFVWSRISICKYYYFHTPAAFTNSLWQGVLEKNEKTHLLYWISSF